MRLRRRRLPPRVAAAALAALLALAGCGEDAAPRATAPKLLLLLTVDTLRADHLGAYGSELGLTPNLDALAAESLVFETTYAPAPFTVPSLAALHTGRHPLELGLQLNVSSITDDVGTLAEAFAARGWKTAAVVSNVVLRGREDLGRGFEIYDDTLLQVEAVRRWPERIASQTTDAALDIVEIWRSDSGVAERPLLLWVHYQDPHGPYTPPEGWRERYTGLERGRAEPARLPEVASPHGEGGIPHYQRIGDEDEVAFYRAGYDAEIAYMDQELGRLLDALRERGLLERVVFAADHGEALGEHDFWFAHGHHLTDEALHVPLFLKLPGLSPGRRGDVTSLLDLLPTLLGAVLGETAPEGLTGRDLLAPGADAHDSVPLLATLSSYRERRLGIVADGYKLILTRRNDVWQPQLFRRGHEDVDLAAPAPQVTAALREKLWAQRARSDGEVAPLREVTPTERAQLEALGYGRGSTEEPAP
jgi:arylsulfatase